MSTNQNTKSPEETAALNASQVEFSLNPAFISPPVQTYFEAQARYFKEFEKLSTAWLERWQEATQSMIKASSQMTAQNTNAPTPAKKKTS